MKVLKFGGTSLATPERLIEVLRIASLEKDCVLVLSAVSGTTNALVEIIDDLNNANQAKIIDKVQELNDFYKQYNYELNESKSSYLKTAEYLETVFKKLSNLCINYGGHNDSNRILAFGEQISTNLAHIKAQELYGKKYTFLNALDFMLIDESSEPNTSQIAQSLDTLMAINQSSHYITQGFICLNSSNEVDNLRRGGSDYTASLIGEAIAAEEIQIWTDIDGMHNNDPRIIEDTSPIRQMSYNEAAELAYFGAKILHPQSVFPAKRANIPLRLKYTLDSRAEGTCISNQANGSGVKAIAAKDGITAIKIKSSRMLMAYGFLTKVFEVFENHKTSIDMITTSEVAVSLTIDDNSNLTEILNDLNEFGDTEVDQINA